MAAAIAQRPASTSHVTGGDRLYVLARWLLLITIFILSTFVHRVTLLPPSATERFGQIFWAYVLFSLVTALLVVSPRTQRLVPWSYVLDRKSVV